jgi:hypothetical protein
MYVITNHTLVMLHWTVTVSQFDVKSRVKRQKMPVHHSLEWSGEETW